MLYFEISPAEKRIKLYWTNSVIGTDAIGYVIFKKMLSLLIERF